MNPSNSITLPLINATMSAAGTVIGVVDTLGYDYLQFDIGCKSASAAETAVTILRVCESDTATAVSDISAYTDATPVTAFVGAAAVSTSAGFVLPARSSTTDNTYRLNIDLKGRARYIGCNFSPTLTVSNYGATYINAVLSRVQDGADIAIVATGTRGCRLIVNG